MTHPVVDIDRPSASCWTLDYRLRHCDGYVVSGPRGSPGYVDEVVLSDEGDATALLVYGDEPFLVPIDLVDAIDAHGEVVFVRDAPPPAAAAAPGPRPLQLAGA